MNKFLSDRTKKT